MKKRFLVLAMALCMVFAFGFAFAEEDTETPEVMDHADCGVEGTDWEAVMDEEDYVPATCEADGMIRKHCSVCGVYVEETVLPKLGGHDVQVDAAVEPTCTETGLTEGKSCHNMITLADGTQVKCDYVEVAQEVVPANGHGEAEPVDPDWRPENYDCEAGFSTPAQCSICKEELKIEIFVTFEHEPEVIEAVAETCTTTGLTEGSKCSVCGEILVAQQVIAALGHTEIDVSAVAPDCENDGLTAGVMCTVCGEFTVPQEVVPALGHWLREYTVAPTTEDIGYDHEVCLREGCNYYHSYNYKARLSDDLGFIVFDVNDVPVDYDLDQDVYGVMEITAAGEADGTYPLRKLYISLELIEELYEREVETIIFIVGDNELEFSIDLFAETELPEKAAAFVFIVDGENVQVQIEAGNELVDITEDVEGLYLNGEEI